MVNIQYVVGPYSVSTGQAFIFFSQRDLLYSSVGVGYCTKPDDRVKRDAVAPLKTGQRAKSRKDIGAVNILYKFLDISPFPWKQCFQLISEPSGEILSYRTRAAKAKNMI